MLSQELNDQITRIGPNASAGNVLRRYWQPAALADELDGDHPLPVNLMGERLVLLRDGEGALSLHTREASVDEAPAHHPPRSEIRVKLDGVSYPVADRKGVIFAYLGPGEPPGPGNPADRAAPQRPSGLSQGVQLLRSRAGLGARRG